MGFAAPAPTPNTRKAGTPRIAAITAVTMMASSRLSQKLEMPDFEDEDAGGVASDSEEGGVAETGDARVAPDDVQAHSEEAVDHHLGDQAGHEGGDEERQQQHDDGDDEQSASTGSTSRARRPLGRHQNTFLPISPLGRTSRMMRKTM